MESKAMGCVLTKIVYNHMAVGNRSGPTGLDTVFIQPFPQVHSPEHKLSVQFLTEVPLEHRWSGCIECPAEECIFLTYCLALGGEWVPDESSQMLNIIWAR